MKSVTASEDNRWFWIYVGNLFASGALVVAAFSLPARADSELVFNESEVEVVFRAPASVPTAFQAFDRDVLIGHELEALEALENAEIESTCADTAAEELSLKLASRK